MVQQHSIPDALLHPASTDRECAHAMVAWLADLAGAPRPLRAMAGALCAIETDAPVREGLARALGVWMRETDIRELLAFGGMPSETGFFDEFFLRLWRRCIPVPASLDAPESLLSRLAPHGAPPARALRRIVAAVAASSRPDPWSAWRDDLSDALRALGVRAHALSLGASFRRHLRVESVADSAFGRADSAAGLLADDWLAGRDPAAAAARLCECLPRCFDAVAQVRKNMESGGISVNLLQQCEALEVSLRRMGHIAAVMAPAPGTDVHGALAALLADLTASARRGQEIRSLFRDHFRRLHERLVDCTGDTGDHYIARSRKEYGHILVAAAGGGLLTTSTAAFKATIHALAVSPALAGTLYSLNYALSFLGLQHFGLMLATKQPAMTAATLAKVVRDHNGRSRDEALVDEVACLVRSQLASATSNILATATGAIVLSEVWRLAFGHPFMAQDPARALYDSLSPTKSMTALYAVETGVILWLSSLCGAWLENACRWHRLPSRLALCGSWRARLGAGLSKHAAGWGTNISLGFMLGFAPEIGHFLGLPLDIRHVTLSAASLALAYGSLGSSGGNMPAFLHAVAGMGVIFVCNLGVSFSLSLWTALRAFDLPRSILPDLTCAVGRRILKRPLSFVLPE